MRIYMDMILFDVILKNIDLISQEQIVEEMID